MPDSVDSKPPQHDDTSARNERAGFQEAPGEEQAESARQSLLSGGNANPAGFPPTLERMDSTMRAEVVEQMQEEHGNLFVQRLLVQREPAPSGLIVDDAATDVGP